MSTSHDTKPAGNSTHAVSRVRWLLKNPPVPRWDDLDQEQEAAQLAALREWVHDVLLAQNPEKVQKLEAERDAGKSSRTQPGH